MNDIDSDDDDVLDEYRAVVDKVDAAVGKAFTLAADAVACKRGCHDCCAPGLTVLPVEAEAIARYTEVHHTTPGARDDRCTFLSDDGACTIYQARPLLCRTHGLALRAHGDVSVCVLNYKSRAPTNDETLDAERIMALLVTVDRRFRERAGLPDDGARIPLGDLHSP